MLMFVFGAGASFDSDPQRVPFDPDLLSSDEWHRPPLAAGLFSPTSNVGREAVQDFPRAAPILMELRQAVAQGRDVEEVLEGLAEGQDDYPEAKSQLLAFRAYLARLLRDVPDRWIEECQGLTNYVALLNKAHQWNTSPARNTSDAIACVTFNYDTMLEEAAHSVFGHRMTELDSYTSHDRLHVFKPHGSISWRQSAHWPDEMPLFGDQRVALDAAIDHADSIQWDDSWDASFDADYQDLHDMRVMWLPALSIPVRRESVFTMPSEHKAAMIEDLAQVTTLVAIGWRARERHFLEVVQENMPADPAQLVAVAESDLAARATVDSLWETGRFNRYAISSAGFSGFVASRDWATQATGRQDDLLLDDLLAGGGAWTNRQPGAGLSTEEAIGPRVRFGPGRL